MSYSSYPLRRPRPPRLGGLYQRARNYWLYAVVALIVVLLPITMIVLVRSTAKTVTFTVTDKAVVATHDNNGHKYMIFTDHGTYKDVDSWSFFKFNSADVYGQLKVNHTYTCTVSGFRVPILSQNNNIIHCHEGT